jgi:hypothetical protein
MDTSILKIRRRKWRRVIKPFYSFINFQNSSVVSKTPTTTFPLMTCRTGIVSSHHDGATIYEFTRRPMWAAEEARIPDAQEILPASQNGHHDA